MDQVSTQFDDVVVGLDSSESGRAALAWAAAYARSSGSRLHVLHVVDYGRGSPMVWAPGFGSVGYAVSFGTPDYAQPDLKALFSAINPEPGWVMRSVGGSVGHELVQASAAARLLVVGTHEHTGLGRVLEGSVSHYCLSRAECPVVAVPAPVAPHENGQEPLETELSPQEKLGLAPLAAVLP